MVLMVPKVYLEMLEMIASFVQMVILLFLSSKYCWVILLEPFSHRRRLLKIFKVSQGLYSFWISPNRFCVKFYLKNMCKAKIKIRIKWAEENGDQFVWFCWNFKIVFVFTLNTNLANWCTTFFLKVGPNRSFIFLKWTEHTIQFILINSCLHQVLNLGPLAL